jgi:hypothetical protein
MRTVDAPRGPRCCGDIALGAAPRPNRGVLKRWRNERP